MMLQACEVHVRVVDLGRSAAAHLITATLELDGTRHFKINGKHRSSREVKARLQLQQAYRLSCGAGTCAYTLLSACK